MELNGEIRSLSAADCKPLVVHRKGANSQVCLGGRTQVYHYLGVQKDWGFMTEWMNDDWWWLIHDLLLHHSVILLYEIFFALYSQFTIMLIKDYCIQLHCLATAYKGLPGIGARSGKLKHLHFIALDRYITLPCPLLSKNSGGLCIVLHLCSETTSSAEAVVRLSSSFAQHPTKWVPDAWEGLWSPKHHSYYLAGIFH